MTKYFNKASRRERQVIKAIGRRLRRLRIEKGLSQTSIAEVLGVSFQQVQKYERGVNRIAACKLILLARVLDVPVGTFFAGDE